MKIALWLVALPILALGCGRGSGDGSGRVVLQNKGSDTLVNVAQAWAEAYKEVDPNVAIAVTGGGSGTGISSLINGTVDIANASRKMKQKEIDMAKKNGIEPVEHIVGFDALAVYLHPDNPVEKLTLAQLADIYGEHGTTESWKQLGVEFAGCGSDEIIRVSRQNNSGTYVYFKEAVLGKNVEYKLGSRDMHGSKDVVDLVEHTPCAIGFSGLAYATKTVKLAAVAKTEAGPYVMPSTDTAIDRTYPIARPLFMYTAGEPTGAVKVYLDWILSDEGQRIILNKGYAPVRPISSK